MHKTIVWTKNVHTKTKQNKIKQITNKSIKAKRRPIKLKFKLKKKCGAKVKWLATYKYTYLFGKMFTQLNILWTTQCIILIACYDAAIYWLHTPIYIHTDRCSNFASPECALWFLPTQHHIHRLVYGLCIVFLFFLSFFLPRRENS